MRALSLLFVLLLRTAALAQAPDVYTNSANRFTLRTPDGWKVADEAVRAKLEQAQQVRSGPRVTVMLALTRISDPGDAIVLTSEKYVGTLLSGVSYQLGEKYIRLMRAKAEGAVSDGEPHADLVGGLQFSRADFHSGGPPAHYFTVLAAGIRDHVLEIQVTASTPESLQSALASLHSSLEFRPDWEAPAPSGPASMRCVRISQKVLNALILHKVTPRYPDSARHDHLEGAVILHVMISPAGALDRAWVIEGGPPLSRAALEAVQQWRFRPYLLNGEPQEVDSQITINFELTKPPHPHH